MKTILAILLLGVASLGAAQLPDGRLSFTWEANPDATHGYRLYGAFVGTKEWIYITNSPRTSVIIPAPKTNMLFYVTAVKGHREQYKLNIP